MANIRVGKPDVAPDVAAHTKGVIEGNRGKRQKNGKRAPPTNIAVQ